MRRLTKAEKAEKRRLRYHKRKAAKLLNQNGRHKRVRAKATDEMIDRECRADDRSLKLMAYHNAKACDQLLHLLWTHHGPSHEQQAA